MRCLAAPVFGAKGSVIGAVSITAAADDITEELVKEYSVKLLDATRRLSEKIGYFTAKS